MSIEFLKQGGSIRVGTFVGWERCWGWGGVGIPSILGWRVIIRLESFNTFLIYDLSFVENLNVYRGTVFQRIPG